MNKLHDLPDDFDVVSYKELNPDLKSMSSNECKMHYIEHGINEKRVYKLYSSLDFDADSYRDLNCDLRPLSDDECKIHYITYGKKEERLLNYFSLYEQFAN